MYCWLVPTTLSDAQVLLLSAQDAMLSRLILRGKAGKEERLRFGKLAFGARKAATTPDEDYMQVCEPEAWPKYRE